MGNAGFEWLAAIFADWLAEKLTGSTIGGSVLHHARRAQHP
jgi:hypothetical protein